MQYGVLTHAPRVHLPVDLQYGFVAIQTFYHIVACGILGKEVGYFLQDGTVWTVHLESLAGPGIVFDRSFSTIGIPGFFFKFGNEFLARLGPIHFDRGVVVTVWGNFNRGFGHRSCDSLQVVLQYLLLDNHDKGKINA